MQRVMGMGAGARVLGAEVFHAEQVMGKELIDPGYASLPVDR